MSISGIALTGLRASQMRLTASASNVANSATTAYKPQRVEQSPLPDGGTAARTVADGGTVLRYEPTASKADARGMVAAPDVDLTQEAVDQMAAVRDYKANVKVIAAADEMTRSTLELWG